MMQLNHTTPLHATAAFGVSLTFLFSVPTGIFPIDIAVRKSLGFNVYELRGSE